MAAHDRKKVPYVRRKPKEREEMLDQIGSDEVVLDVPTAADMRSLGVRIGGLLRAGDLLVLTGDLGAGKTTLTQGIGEGLNVRGPVTSPTFVIARVHPSLVGGPALVHADAYRLGGFAELDDLDLDAAAGDSVTVVEWGRGLAEGLADDRLEVIIYRGDGGSDETRKVTIIGVGARWSGLAAELA
jgi:tRNA threonylcarbamoyladenosine biosynthesis protein TsaE